MDAYIVEVLNKRDNGKKEFLRFDAAYKALQAICEHSWRYEGHGHNREFYECSKCGDTKEE